MSRLYNSSTEQSKEDGMDIPRRRRAAGEEERGGGSRKSEVGSRASRQV